MKKAAKNQYHIVYGNSIIAAKFTAHNLSDVWRKYNQRCEELLVNKQDIPSRESFGNLAWAGNLKKDYKQVILRLAQVTESGYVFENKE